MVIFQRTFVGEMDFRLAVEAFVRGFAVTKSFTHPYEMSQYGDIWIMRDAPGNRRERLAEFATSNPDPRSIRKLASDLEIGRYAVGYLTPEGEDPELPKKRYKANGFRLTEDARHVVQHSVLLASSAGS